MNELPSGTVTFLFTDIEGSTRLLHKLGDAYADALTEHRRCLREAFVHHGGVEIDTQGDAFFVAFPRASGALAAAEEAQEALDGGPIRVRMGLHTGEPLVIEEGYVGIDVHRAARIAAAGHGGQILLSQSTRDLADLDDLRDLGLHRLKDLTAPERIYQLGNREFPPLKSLNLNNLPVQPTPLIGRSSELGEVVELLQATRLLTLSGTGGSGKTRLAFQAAAELVDEFRDGVWFVSLAALSDIELFFATVSSALGVKDDLLEFLGSRRLLLLLDNLEQLLPAVAPMIAELSRAPGIKIIATSRERLSIAGEQEYVVPPLSLHNAVALFTARARQLKPSFEPDDHVAAIARRIDGLPLALELAAARVKVLTTQQIADRIGASLDLLTTGARDAPERQQTLRATVDWSHQLLDDREKLLFARLAVFAGSFDIDAVEAVCSADLDTLQSLVDKSLLRQTEDGRFFLLETIREFAVERLEASGEAEDVGNRHADHYFKVAGGLTVFFNTTDHGELARQFDRDSYNLRTALERFIQSSDTRALSMVESLWPYWLLRGRLAEGTRWAERSLDAAPDASPQLVADVLSTIGEFARYGGDSGRAVELKEAALERYRELGAPPHVAAALHDLADVWAHEGDYARARALSLEALEIRRELGTPAGIAHALSTLGDVAMFEGDLDEALGIYEEILRLLPATGSVDYATSLYLLAECLRRLENYGDSATKLAEALEIAAELNMSFVLPEMLYTAAALTLRSDAERAALLVGAAEKIRGDTGLDYFDPAECGRIQVAIREALDESRHASAREAGEHLSGDAAVKVALESLA